MVSNPVRFRAWLQRLYVKTYKIGIKLYLKAYKNETNSSRMDN